MPDAGRTTPHRPATPYLDDGDLALYHGDVLHVLRQLPSGIAQTCVTSPPYWGLRDYGTGTWTGGDADCGHSVPLGDGGAAKVDGYDVPFRTGKQYTGQSVTGNVCHCGAQRVDDQLGLEATPTQYVTRMVEVFREVGRVLRDDGTLWLNIGDSYASGEVGRVDNGHTRDPSHVPTGLKPKDLVGIPWRLAFALQTDGWYLRSDIIWAKPNPMPESVTDRPTKSHEYVFLFSKQARYMYDADAIREHHAVPLHAPGNKKWPTNGDRNDGDRLEETWGNPAGRNQRSVWQIATQPFPEAHFATYPEELVRRCILAGTSERGECVECGAPWRRVTERPSPPGRDTRTPGAHTPTGNGKMSGQKMQEWLDANPPRTMGWEPSCSCSSPGMIDRYGPMTRPQLVLDPFIGSGTTALVARKHGRRSIGIDLSRDYLELAARRTRQLSLLGGC